MKTPVAKSSRQGKYIVRAGDHHQSLRRPIDSSNALEYPSGSSFILSIASLLSISSVDVSIGALTTTVLKKDTGGRRISIIMYM
jgi:hypothetical protein